MQLFIVCCAFPAKLQDPYTESRRIFFSKVNQYIKERHLDPKYACAFLLNMTEWNSTEVKEVSSVKLVCTLFLYSLLYIA